MLEDQRGDFVRRLQARTRRPLPIDHRALGNAVDVRERLHEAIGDVRGHQHFVSRHPAIHAIGVAAELGLAIVLERLREQDAHLFLGSVALHLLLGRDAHDTIALVRHGSNVQAHLGEDGFQVHASGAGGERQSRNLGLHVGKLAQDRPRNGFGRRCNGLLTFGRRQRGRDIDRLARTSALVLGLFHDQLVFTW